MSLLWCDSTHKDSMSMKSFGRKLTVFCIRKRAKDNQSNDIEVDEIMTKRSKRRKKEEGVCKGRRRQMLLR